ncbi:MAG: cob(I)yrinic acid a,c-diamide adenosyltransferase [Chlamydiales bacterium]
MKIYTKTGDKGDTSLFNGERVSKSDEKIHTLGTLDECNATLGLAISYLPDEPKFKKVHNQLIEIQHALFDIGAAVATPRSSSNEKKINQTRFDNQATKSVEDWIDEWDKELPPLKTFILPGGHPSAAVLHLARNICRRAERHAVPLSLHEDVSEQVMMYLNRLSDYLFVLSRVVNHLTGIQESPWRGK